MILEANQLIPYKNAIDYEITEKIKDELSKAKISRRPFYLTPDEFEKILKWKLRGQYGRQKILRTANTEEILQAITELAFSVKHPDPDIEVELKIGIICLLKGVGVPVASAILTLTFPGKYAVIDFRVWRQLFGEQKNSFSITDYKRYLKEVQKLAGELGWTIQEVDLAIWEYDRVNN